MTQPTRRSVLAAGLTVGALGTATLLTACTPSAPAPSASPTPVGPPNWSELASTVTGALALPGTADYATVKLVENPRWDAAMPLAVLSAVSAKDVAAALAFAARYRIPVALRAGGHGYPGYSAGGAAGTDVKPSLVIDVRPLDAITLAADNTVTLGAGASLAVVYDTIGAKGRSIAAGSCATVGITGLTLGGGVGVLTRAYGLTCDSLTAVEIVTADGTVHTATAKTDADLFWACRGGGGGHLGVVTSLTFATQPAPTVTMFSLTWPAASAAAVVRAWQSWAPTADPKLWSTLKLLTGANYNNGIGVFLSGTWLGAAAELQAQLAPIIAGAGTPTHNGSSQHSYRDAMLSYAGCAAVPIAQCNTGSGGSLKRESFAATSHVAYQPLDASGIQTLIAQVASAKSVPGMKEGGISMDALGGQVGALAADATAFPHRSALMTVQYTATFADGVDPAPLDAFVRGFRAALVPQWGDGAYVNYADASLTDPLESYFKANKTRLAAVRKKYDPTGFFSQPQSF
ncbi:FAD-binding oxidoreductase [Lacisediminihabitans changchengi]|uniref:FAD-dependent oxidoreductase n=1 Tax=Lacisediminihabitans changchengi TaxID=2787634 RepID=A0A934SLD0_9MICO|nr:FAD-binding protein [Lacisediminihabitans changchengi]MBK4347470.1 FAD-dependent oxidoreductase [Lacisediminihabitans changchengi]